MVSILVVDDDREIRQLLAIHLKDKGFSVVQAKDGKEALEKLASNSIDLAIVDIMMPIVDGYELTEEIRDFYDIPIILLTAKDQIDDKERGFRSGADDYIVKPFEPRELVFRIKALLRRYEKNYEEVIQVGSVQLNRKKYTVEFEEQVLLLPLKEFELLYLLASYPGQVFPREQIIERIWGFDYEGDERTVDVHIKRLRERFSCLKDDFYIRTVRNVGYVLED